MKHRYIKNVTTLLYDVQKCVGCGRCTEVCPHGVFEINNKKAAITDKDLCMECGACVKNCPVNALEVNAGVGCAYAMIMGWLTGNEPSCDCSGKIENTNCC